MVFFPTALGVAFLGYRLADRVDAATADEITALQSGDVTRFDRWATTNFSHEWQDRSDYLRNALLGSVALLSLAPPLYGDEWSDAVTLGVMSAEVFGLLLGVTNITKTLSHRARPYLYNESLTVQERLDVSGDHREGWGYLSFFSGHAASSFAAAMFVSKVFSDVYGPSAWSKALWGATFSAAALVAYARVEGGAHFPTDVFVGAAVGSALGYLVPALHRIGPDRALSLGVAPTGVAVRLTLR